MKPNLPTLALLTAFATSVLPANADELVQPNQPLDTEDQYELIGAGVIGPCDEVNDIFSSVLKGAFSQAEIDALIPPNPEDLCTVIIPIYEQ